MATSVVTPGVCTTRGVPFSPEQGKKDREVENAKRIAEEQRAAREAHRQQMRAHGRKLDQEARAARRRKQQEIEAAYRERYAEES